MADVATLQARLDALEASRATGELSVEYAGRSVTYKSDAQMAAAIADLKRQIAASQSPGPVRVVRVSGNKGF